METFQAAISGQRTAAATTPAGERPAAAVERLPFTIKLVRNEDELHKAVRIRHAAYARHVPEFARKLMLPEDYDYEDDSIVLLAESKLDGSPLGTARLQTNLHRPLPVEQSVELPEWLQGKRMAEVSRLGVDVGRVGRLVKTALLKACVQYCQQNGIEWALATGRAPIDRQYEQLTFVDVFEPGAYLPLRHVGNIPHRIMAFDIDTIDERWSAAQHPLLEFFCRTVHPDIDLSRQAGPRRAIPAAPRVAPQPPVLHAEALALI
jgi:GNAT superfamily N-acetyltransferase